MQLNWAGILLQVVESILQSLIKTPPAMVDQSAMDKHNSDVAKLKAIENILKA